MRLPFFENIGSSQIVLIAGVGGGFDVFAGLPLFFWLRALGKTVHLANLSFTRLVECEGERPVPSLLTVLPDTVGPAKYFPEVHLAQWLAKRFGETPIYAIDRSGARPVMAAYDWLIRAFHPDTLILVDGGMDSLMRGDEAGLGTPHEDATSLLAAHSVVGPEKKVLTCIGFGVDAFHGVCHASFLQNVAALIQENAFLGAWSLTREMDEFQLYQEAYNFVVSRMPHHPSIVCSSVISAIEGRFGDHHATDRTRGWPLFINPLMSLYWTFDLNAVARRNLYLTEIRDTELFDELHRAIVRFRAALPERKPWMNIPC
jgi:hypothetical protein